MNRHTVPSIQFMFVTAFALVITANVRADDKPWIEFKGESGPGKGKRVVLVSGDEEYRSEETLPQLAKILAKHHGFDCTVLFAIDPKTGNINPNQSDNIPGLEALKDADLLVLFTRFRRLPDEQMKHIAEYVESGRPIVALRTATHAFDTPGTSKFKDYKWDKKGGDWDGGFGRRVLGETWITHHGNHGHESTKGIIPDDVASHPILRGIKSGDIWGPTDVYGVRLPLPGDSKPLVLGQVLTGMKPTDPPVEGKKNDPMMPIAWTKTFDSPSGKKARTFTTTMGASQDFANEGVRRLLVNACYWCVGLEDKIPDSSDVAIVGKFKPRTFHFGGYKPNVKPADLID